MIFSAACLPTNKFLLLLVAAGVLQFLSLQSLALAEATTTTWYFNTSTSPCQGDSCLELSQIFQDTSLFNSVFRSNTTLVFMSGDHILDFDHERFAAIRDLENLYLMGSRDRETVSTGIVGPASRIVCTSPFAMAFINISKLVFANLTFSGCGANVTNELYIEAFLIQTRGIHMTGVEQKVALFLINIDTFNMTSCLVEKSLGYGLLGVNVLGASRVFGTIFIANNVYTTSIPRCKNTPESSADTTACSGGNALFVYEDLVECPSNKPQYFLSIEHSIFLLGVNGFGGMLSDVSLTRGTGIGLVMAQGSYGIEITLSTVGSSKNSAIVGANIYIAFYDIVDNSSVLIQDSFSTMANEGLLLLPFFEQVSNIGGGLHVDYGLPVNQSPQYVPVCLPVGAKFRQGDVITILNSTFGGNVANVGAGAIFTMSPLNRERAGIRIEDSVFSSNVGISGTALSFEQRERIGQVESHLVLRNVSFFSNSYVTPIKELTELYTTLELSTVQLVSSKNTTMVDCLFAANEGSALASFESFITTSGYLKFENNSGVTGGAVNLENSQLIFLPNTKIDFLNNYALSRGGAINVFKHNTNFPCFFQVKDPSFLSEPNITLHFAGNFAEEAGSVLYGGSIDRCIVNFDSSFSSSSSQTLFDALTNIEPHNPATSEISSVPTTVCLCELEHHNCSQRVFQASIFPGATTFVPVITVGQRNGAAPSNVYAITDEIVSIEAAQEIQQVEKTCTTLNFTVRAFKGNTRTNIILRSNSLVVPGNIRMDIQVKPCPIGFVLDNRTGACDCDQVLDYITTCDINKQTISRRGGSWVNASFQGPNDSYDGIMVLSRCPRGYCLPFPTNINLLTPDTQCDFNRTGLLCGSCKDGLSVTLSSGKCVECSNGYLGLLLAFVVAGFGLVAVLYVFDLTVSSGTLSGIIFYANVIHTNYFLFFPPNAYNPITVFIAWLNLDPGVDICLYDGFNSYARTWLTFVFPIYIWLIVIAIIVVSRFWSQTAKNFGSRSVPVFATLILLSYNKVLNGVIISLSSSSIANPDGSHTNVWSSDGNMRYMQGKHAVLGTFAILILLLLIIPYTLLLVLAPLPFVQSRTTHRLLTWVNTLKPFLDAYQGPFKTNFRNWMGILLLVRVFLSMWISINIGDYDNTTVILATIAIMMFLLVCVGWVSGGGMYNKWPNNLLECSFYLNLGVLSTINLHLYAHDIEHTVPIILSGTVAMAELVAIFVFHTYRRLEVFEWFKKYKTKMAPIFQKDKQKTSNIEEASVVLTTSHKEVIHTSNFMELREPLLED